MRRPLPGEMDIPIPLTPSWTRPKIGLALGGGFARGMAHIGVLKVLEEEGIRPDFVAGTSVGAVIGAAYCSGVSARELSEIACLIRFSDIARYTISRYGLCSNDRLSALLNRVLKVRTFEELKIPLAVTATEFLTGESVVFTSGTLIDRVRASCAYPGVFTPVTVDGKLMVDGLLAHSVPATPLKRMGAEKVISVYFSAHWVKAGGPRHVLDIIGQCFSIAQANMSSFWRADTDCLVEPDVEPFGFDDFAKTLELVKVGEAATRKAMPQIRSWLDAPAIAPMELPIASTKKSPVVTQSVPPLIA
jgi:NTE family protein